MADKYLHNVHFNSRYEKKRGSVDNALKPERKYKHNDHRQSKKDIGQLTIDLHPQKNITKLSLQRNNFTHRIDVNSQSNSNLCDLRQEVEQLRMENQSLRQQIKALKNNESELKFQISNLKNQLLIEEQKYQRLEGEYEMLENKTEKYRKKINQLFQDLIKQKRKNMGIEEDPYKVKRIALSPSNLSICNSLNLRKFQQEGFRDYYNSAKANSFKADLQQKQEMSRLDQYHRFKNFGWNIQSSEYEPISVGPRSGIAQTFGTKF